MYWVLYQYYVRNFSTTTWYRYLFKTLYLFKIGTKYIVPATHLLLSLLY